MKNKVKALFYYQQENQIFILLGKRSSSDGNSFWWLPGGSVEENEDPFDALKRELDEEVFLPFLLHKAMIARKTYPSFEFQGNNHNVVFFIEVPALKATPEAREEFEDMKWFEMGKLPENMSREYAFLKNELPKFLIVSQNQDGNQ